MQPKPMSHLKTFNRIRNGGFTLIEVLVAIMILSVAMVTLTSSWSGSLFAYRKSDKVQLITSLLKSKISELEIKYAELPFDQITEQEEGEYKEFSDLKWKAEVKLLAFPDLSQILVSSGQNDEMLITTIQKMTEHFSKNIKEMKVTITWSAGKSNVEYSATTYLVNYQNQLPAIGGP